MNAHPRSDINIFVAGASVTFQCKPGFALSSQNAEYTCQGDGTWDNQDLNPKCLRREMAFCFLMLFFFLR